MSSTVNIPASSPGTMVIPLHFSGQYNASLTAVARFAMPQRVRVLSVQATARASGGTSPTLSIDVQAGGVSILTSPMSITAGSITFGSITAAGRTIADEAVVTVNFTIGGTSPTWNDIMVTLMVQRL